ncbi:potassium transporter Trk [Microbacterium dauci]|uniref:Potassium transporter Trk n=1 Tax=Microbacterium dauci TaxID=3048008 RepID=A0ABT6ZD84_9MICO|nr:potassium transporter Trk [Microbacterium sp. LX3-4]MDJ1113941.1 potassium transporter Trk [Microbacterium sp. LX3-4]
MAEHTESHVESAELRRSPRFSVFFVLGGGLGLLVALILTFAFDGSAQASAAGVTYSTTQVFGFLLLVCVPVGVALGALVALVFDRASRRHVRTVRIEHETVREDED